MFLSANKYLKRERNHLQEDFFALVPSQLCTFNHFLPGMLYFRRDNRSVVFFFPFAKSYWHGRGVQVLMESNLRGGVIMKGVVDFMKSMSQMSRR